MFVGRMNLFPVSHHVLVIHQVLVSHHVQAFLEDPLRRKLADGQQNDTIDST